MIRVFAEPSKDFHLTREQTLLVRREAVPVLDRFGFRREFRALRHDAKADLPGGRCLAQPVPSGVEPAVVFGDPFLGYMVRGVYGARGKIQEERLFGRERLDRPYPIDRPVCHVSHEMIIRIVRRLDLGCPVVDQRRPLVGFAAEETVEPVEARTRGPSMEGTRWADFPDRGFMIFAERRSAVAIQAENFGQRRDRARLDAGVAGKRRRDLGDAAHVVHVMVAPGQQGGACGRAQGSGVELIVEQPSDGQALEGGHVDRAAGCARLTESYVVEQDDQHIGSIGRGTDFEPSRRNDVPRVQDVDCRRPWLGDWQDGAVERRRCGNAGGGLRCLCLDGAAQPGTSQGGCQRGFRGRYEQVAAVHSVPFPILTSDGEERTAGAQATRQAHRIWSDDWGLHRRPVCK